MNLRAIFAAFVFSLLCPAVGVAEHPNTPGSVAIVKLGATTAKPVARFGRREVLVVKRGIEWFGVVGLPHDLVPGEYIVTSVVDNDPATNVAFMVRRHNQSNIAVPDISDRELPDESELLSWKSAEKFSPTLPFVKPVFGDKLEEFDHAIGSLTLVSADGASVVAPKAGLVTAVVQNGPGAHQVTIDHGAGVFSIIAPIYEVAVSRGDEVLESMRLGFAGAMAAGGRSGINWAVALNGVFVDPGDIIE